MQSKQGPQYEEAFADLKDRLPIYLAFASA